MQIFPKTSVHDCTSHGKGGLQGGGPACQSTDWIGHSKVIVLYLLAIQANV